jgi:hypothetical protein
LRGDLGAMRRLPPRVLGTGAGPRRGDGSCLACRRRLAGRARAPQCDGRGACDDGIERRDQPWHAREAARKHRSRRAAAGEPMPLQERFGGGALAELVERKCAQHMGSRGAPRLGEAVEEGERPPRLAIEHRGGRSHEQNGHVLGAGSNRLLRESQDGRASARIHKRLDQPGVPDMGWVEPLLEQIPLSQRRNRHRSCRPVSLRGSRMPGPTAHGRYRLSPIAGIAQRPVCAPGRGLPGSLAPLLWIPRLRPASRLDCLGNVARKRPRRFDRQITGDSLPLGSTRNIRHCVLYGAPFHCA